MLDPGPERRWDHPFPRTGCSLYCAGNSTPIARPLNTQHVAGAGESARDWHRSSWCVLLIHRVRHPAPHRLVDPDGCHRSEPCVRV